MRPELLLAFVAMGVATYLTRAPLLVWLADRRLPAWLERYLAALPVAILTALALPLVVLPGGAPPPLWNPQVPGAVLVAVVARGTGNLLLAVAAGVALVALLRALVG